MNLRAGIHWIRRSATIVCALLTAGCGTTCPDTGGEADREGRMEASLPRVLIIGDSITLITHDVLKESLKGKAKVFRPSRPGAVINCGPTERGVEQIHGWLGDYQKKGSQWDVIRFNFGLHDLKQPYDAAANRWSGRFDVPVEPYKRNLEIIIGVLRQTGAKLIWATTTPVPGDLVGENGIGRQKGTEQVYNAAAREVLARHPEIEIHDLWEACQGHYGEGATGTPWLEGSNVHHTEYGRNELGRAMARMLLKSLESMQKQGAR